MFDEEALKKVMAAVLRVPEAQIGPDTSTDTLPTWDSLRHMNLVLALEQEFGVSIPDEDAANLSSYALIKLVLNELTVD
ncbi:acyl carrier protein [Caulobacter sp. Root655]|jgi:acyl carrier protein|uniref:acyl carrier protein n=1 Tax=Caulobacter sp. Root655 TaxID=1736578 RepID=UPI0006FEC166|nr:acyl carrier protein [Caulobacter sp. Root655]KRA60357.1 acyl carrier protein [Caulobacter sp. Root655]